MLKQTTAIIYALLISGVNLKSVAALAGAESIDTAAQSGIQINRSSQKDSAIRLEVRQAPLAKILKELAEKTGAIVHYSVLPDAPVTATCVGANIWQLMDCLVAKQVGLVANKPESGQPAEFWLLGSSVGSCQAVTIRDDFIFSKSTITQQESNNSELDNISPERQQKSDALLEKLRQAKTSEERIQALSDLSSGGVIEDPNIRRVLNDAAMDREATIRTQAVITSAALDKDSAAEILTNALNDRDASVRMAALDMANGEKKVLEQALADSDDSVRGYAAAKLAEIQQRQKRLQQ